MGKQRYHLLSNRLPNAEKFLYLYGSGSNGKSQLLHLLRGLVGKESCAELRLSDMKVSASLERLVGALAMIGSEASTKTEMETLKLLVSREPLHCNPKYRDPFDIEPECLVSQASNYPPHFEDTSSAMARRVIALHLKHTFKESDDRIEDLAHRIVTEEYPILLGFALAGAHEISEMGRFEVPATIKEHSTQEVSAGNPFEGFGELLEFCPFEVEERELYAAYKRWSLENGVRPLKTLDFKTALERHATKEKSHIERVRLLTPVRCAEHPVSQQVLLQDCLVVPRGGLPTNVHALACLVSRGTHLTGDNTLMQCYVTLCNASTLAIRPRTSRLVQPRDGNDSELLSAYAFGSFFVARAHHDKEMAIHLS